MKVNNPRSYKVAGLGGWGIVEGVVYDNWTEETFTLEQIRKKHPSLKTCTGLDFGYTNDPSAFVVCYLDLQSKDLFVYDEIYQTGLSNQRIAGLIKRSGYGKEKITADSAEPKSIDELHNVHNLRIKGAKKGKDSIKNGIQWIQDLKIHVHPRCGNFVTEISNYTWDTDRFGKRLNVPIDDFNHLMDAMRYALEDYITGSAWIY
jgi:phage terminase large subunit